jgi:selenocysteine lyase/cysteine desulfurase
MEHFSLDSNVDYFDCAGRSPLPKSVEQVGHDAVSWKVSHILFLSLKFLQSKPWKSLPNFPQEISQKYSKLIGAESADCISIAPSTTFAMTLAAENIIRSGILCPGKYVLVMFGEMESSVYPWQSACQRTGATLLVIPPPDENTTWSEAIIATLENLNPGDLAVILLTCVHWCSGRTVDALGKLSPPFLLSFDVSQRSPAISTPHMKSTRPKTAPSPAHTS